MTNHPVLPSIAGSLKFYVVITEGRGDYNQSIQKRCISLTDRLYLYKCMKVIDDLVISRNLIISQEEVLFVKESEQDKNSFTLCNKKYIKIY